MHCSLDHQCGLLDSTAPTCLHEGLIGSALVAIPPGAGARRYPPLLRLRRGLSSSRSASTQLRHGTCRRWHPRQRTSGGHGPSDPSSVAVPLESGRWRATTEGLHQAVRASVRKSEEREGEWRDRGVCGGEDCRAHSVWS
jgi:hypothetical protein